MKGNSGMSLCDRIGQRGCVPVWLITLCLSLALVSCSSSSSPPAAPDARVNQHLVYEHLLDEEATVKPHQTVVLNLASTKSSLPGSAPGAGYHELPYEISNAGKYKYCIPDNDTHLTEVELYGPSDTLVAHWKKGEPCTSVPLVPGRYTMHVHLNTNESDPPLFMKPHDVTVTQIGTMKAVRKSVASSYDGQIPANQFLNLKVDSLTDILKANKVNGLKQGWGVATSSTSGEAYGELQQLQFHKALFNVGGYNDNVSQKVSDSASLNEVSQLKSSNLLYVNHEQEQQVSLLQGDIPVILSSGYCLSWHGEQRLVCDDDCMKNGSYVDVNVCDTAGNIVGLMSSGSSVNDSLFRFSSAATHFKLYNPSNSAVNWYNTRWVTGAGASPVDFNVKVRYGTTSGLTFPAMLANEVALFDGMYGQSGFAANTHYWIVNADMEKFDKFSFDNPTNRIRTVIAGRGVRAQIFQNPMFHGSSFYVSPPVDSEMLMTGTDTALLNPPPNPPPNQDGTVGSIRIEPNSNDIPVNEYEHHIIVSTNTCIGCDLRGFDASHAGTEHWGYYGNYVEFRSVNFRDSDLSSANFSLARGSYRTGRIIDSNFENVNFTGANFTHDAFWSCNFRKTDFTKAVLTNVILSGLNADAFYNACPKFEYTDLTTITGFDSYFPVATGSGYNADDWWNKQRQAQACRPSIAHSKVSQNLFADRRLWQFVDASGVDFSDMNLDGYVFAGSNLRNAIFKNASLRGTVFVQADLTGADVSGADLTGAHLEGATLDGVNLYKVKTLSKAVLSGVTLKAPNLSGLDMSGAQLKGGKYTNWDGHIFETFSPASIIGAYMFNTQLNGADLSGAWLQNVSWFGERATGENAVMVGAHFETADMPGLNLMRAHLQGANFTDAVLVNANLSTASSTDYSFQGTTFYQANLKGANLSGANLNGATLARAFIYAGAGQKTATIEVLDDPALNPNRYRYFQQAYSATTPPASTDGIVSCPNGIHSPANNCGTIDSEYWVTAAQPQEPEKCVKRKAQQGETPDDDGMVLVCDSKRHPVNP